MRKSHSDNEQLTRYALGEVSDAEADQIEAYLADHPDAAEFVEAVRADAALLTSALQAEPDLPAASPVTYRMQEYVMEPKREKRFNASAVAIAAAVTLMVVGFLAVRGGELNAPAVALNEFSPNAGVLARFDPAAVAELERLLARRGMTVDEMSEDYLLGVLPYVEEQLAADGDAFRRERVETRNDAAEESVPFSDILTYPGGFPELADSRDDSDAEVPARRSASADAVPAAAPTTPSDVADAGVFGGEAPSEEPARPNLGMELEFAEAEPADATYGGESGIAMVGGTELEYGFSRRVRNLQDMDAYREASPEERQRMVDDLRRQSEQLPDDREAYDHTPSNDFIAVADAPLSTFSVDVDTASYTNVRRMLNNGQMPPADAVRVEEFVNYFDYDYAAPSLDDEHPFAAHLAVAQTPWNPATKLVRIGLKGKEIPVEQRPDMNLVFLLDVSGSMSSADKLPLVKSAMTKLAGTMRENDRVAIVVYAGAAGLVLDSTTDAEQVVSALQSLQAGGSTAGGAGIDLAYATAEKHFIEDGVNRVILCTDGDFNVGTSHTGGLVRLVEEKAEAGTYLTVLGFGTGNLRDAMLEQISNKGEGNYAYIDSEAEAQRVLVDNVGGTLQAIAKDVKIQVEFNPATVAAHRLIGYENRLLADRDFNDDTKDAGDIGVGHTVTALYEIVPTAAQAEDFDSQIAHFQKSIDQIRNLMDVADLTPEGRAAMEKEIAVLEEKIAATKKLAAEPMVDDLNYQEKPAVIDSDELLTVKLRYKQPDAPKEQGTSTLLEFPLEDADVLFEDADSDFKQAVSAAAFAMLLRDSPHLGFMTYDWVIEHAPNDELKELASAAKSLQR